MANWTNLKAAISSVIQANNNQEITGQVLQNVLNSIVDTVGANATFAGIATPSTNPGAPDGPVFYLATQPGSYANFNNIELTGGLAIFKWLNNSWVYEPLININNTNSNAYNSVCILFENGSHLDAGNANAVLSAFMDVSEFDTVTIRCTRPTEYSYRFGWVLSTDTTLIGKIQRGSVEGMTGAEFSTTNTTTSFNTYGRKVCCITIAQYDEGNSTWMPLRKEDMAGFAVVLNNTAISIDKLSSATKNITLDTMCVAPTSAFSAIDAGVDISPLYDASTKKLSFPYAFVLLKNGVEYSIPAGTEVTIIPTYLNGSTVVSTQMVMVFDTSNNTLIPLIYTYYTADKLDLSRYLILGSLKTDPGNGKLYYWDMPFGVIYEGKQWNTRLIETKFDNTSELIENNVALLSSNFEVINNISDNSWSSGGSMTPKNRYIIRYYLNSNNAAVILTKPSDLYYRMYVSATYNGIRTEYNPWTAFSDIKAPITNIKCDSCIDINLSAGGAGSASLEDKENEIINTVIPLFKVVDLNSTDVTSILALNPREEMLPKLMSIARFEVGSSNAALTEPLVLAHFSDIHANAANLKRIVEFCNEYKSIKVAPNKSVPISDIISTGDQVLDHAVAESGTDVDYSWWSNNGGAGVLVAVGNHDSAVRVPAEQGSYDWTGLGKVGTYNKYFAPFIGNWGVTQPSGAEANGLNYYYKDYSPSNVRLIVLDAMFWDSAQNAWLQEILASALSAGLGVLIASHYSPLDAHKVDCTYNSLAYGFSAKGLTTAVQSVEAFITGGGEFIAWLGGHVHVDKFGTLQDYPNQTVILVESAGANTYYDHPYVEGTRCQDSFNIIAVDRNRKVIKLLKVGSQYDCWMRRKGTMCWDYANKEIIFNG